jgi:hypothetical protein
MFLVAVSSLILGFVLLVPVWAVVWLAVRAQNEEQGRLAAGTAFMQKWIRNQWRLAPRTLCAFCSRPADGTRAVTMCNGDPEDGGSWHRLKLPLCDRCHSRLVTAGEAGLVLRSSGERWFAGYRVRSNLTPNPHS